MIDDLLDGLGEAVVGAAGEVLEVAGDVVGGAIDVVGELFAEADAGGTDEEDEARKKAGQNGQK